MKFLDKIRRRVALANAARENQRVLASGLPVFPIVVEPDDPRLPRLDELNARGIEIAAAYDARFTELANAETVGETKAPLAEMKRLTRELGAISAEQKKILGIEG